MRIVRLELHAFRNYRQWHCDPDPSLSIIIGPNAVGKTNLIEAIRLISSGTTFRSARWDEMVMWGNEEARLAMHATGERSPVDVALTIRRDGTRGWRVDGRARRRPADACRFVPTVVFTPDDLLFVKGSAEQRRSMIDALGDQLSKTYASLRKDYARVVRQRNILLKDGVSDTMLEPWDRQLITFGARLHLHRRRLVARVAQAMSPAYERLSDGEPLRVAITDRCGIGIDAPEAGLTVMAIEQALEAELTLRRADERVRGVSLAGPHRDDLVFLIDERDARAFASQGQQRTVTLAWKLAEVAVVTDVLQATPVLLLDDVMSELDEHRRSALTDLVKKDIQTFITTTNTGYFDRSLLAQARVIHIEGDRR